jgi:hypothetical protein
MHYGRENACALVVLALAIAGCGDDAGSGSTDGSGPAGPGSGGSEGGAGPAGPGRGGGATASSSGTGGSTATCSAPPASSCNKTGSIVRGQVSLAPGLQPTSTAGSLSISLSHYRLGNGSSGGVPHAGIQMPNVDLAQGPVEFALDMCTGGEMWSEDNCEFNVIAILDTNGNNAVNGFDTNFLPDPGEAAGRSLVGVSCAGESPCIEVELGCKDGAACTAFADPGACKCTQPSCASPITTCTP